MKHLNELKPFAALNAGLERQTEYFLRARSEIDASNFRTLYGVSFATTGIILAFIAVSALLLPMWHLTWHYVAFTCVMLFFSCLMCLLKGKKLPPHLISLLCMLYTAILMTFVIMIDILPFPNDAATFSGIFLSAMPIVFIVPYYQMLAFQAAFILAFSITTVSVKSQHLGSNDVFHAMVGLVVGFAIYSIVMNLRVREFSQKNSYRISSETDSLTQMLNRAACKKRIDDHLAVKPYDEKCAFVILDVDNFKLVNDRLGHAAGDKVLKTVADAITTVFRKQDICGRFGGDEFIVFVSGIADDAFIKIKCDEINKLLAQSEISRTHPLGASMGGAVLKAGTATTDELFRLADEALYEAKAFGKGIYVSHDFEPGAAARSNKPVMVIVDDNEVDAEVLAMQFEEQYVIKRFTDGALALKYIAKREAEISVILLDMVMPETDGLDILRAVKASPHTAHIPVVAVSADAAFEEKALKYGAADMLTKPIVPATAKLRVNNLAEATARM